ncbi:hypothetical protein BGZ63DRAFT_419947 [Mariannaea sp. PMI_226]|nr:hypothetical protein BGZ63DRAFT_419947 [Mariannaea sp. PMI_226]
MRRFNAIVDTRANPRITPPAIKRWDGAARTCDHWDHLRRDPELWFRNGNCLVYLYGKGESRRGPSFRVPFAALLESKCYPLIQRFIVWEGNEKPDGRELARWNPRNPSRKVELYIPAPSTADRSQAFQYHIATRNFFAWVFRRSMVGRSLGSAIVALLHSMHEFRSDVDDNFVDAMDYFDEEGYLDMANQPNHALAMLYLAELFQMDELYTKAFSHCVGMSDHLLESTEYQFITLESRKLIRRAHMEMETRLSQCCSMLKNFLDDELSEAHLSVSEGARAHLERFRSFLLSFYATKLGYYPPIPSDSRYDFFDPDILWSMREDFEALYDLLVDDQYTSSQTMPATAYGGVCTMQLVHSFDQRHDYVTLEHPMPLMPQPLDPSRRMLWLPGRERLRSGRRMTAHASLIRASNIMKPGLAQNSLVQAYRRFEEESIIWPNRVDKQEKVSIVDARKVRWILVYAVYQVLRSATDTPVEVEQDIGEAAYNLSVSVAHTPPWTETYEMKRILRRQTELFTTGPKLFWPDDPIILESPGKIEIKPDIDYFALTHKDSSIPEQGNSILVLPKRRASMPLPVRSNSLSQALSRTSTLRRSMRMFMAAPSTPPAPAAPIQPRVTYHEIVVHGYGNGTNDVNFNLDGQPIDMASWPDRSDSNASKPDNCGGLTPDSMEMTDESMESESSIDTPSPVSFQVEDLLPDPNGEKKKKFRSRRRHEVVSIITRSVSGRVSKRPPINAVFDIPVPNNTDAYTGMVDQQSPPQRTSSFKLSNPLSPLPRSLTLTRQGLGLPELRRKSQNPSRRRSILAKAIEQQKESKQQSTNDDSTQPYIVPEDADWMDIQNFMDPDAAHDMVDGNPLPAWEQYAELGGLTDMR